MAQNARGMDDRRGAGISKSPRRWADEHGPAQAHVFVTSVYASAWLAWPAEM